MWTGLYHSQKMDKWNAGKDSPVLFLLLLLMYQKLELHIIILRNERLCNFKLSKCTSLFIASHWFSDEDSWLIL
jgi:hypothetical protein